MYLDLAAADRLPDRFELLQPGQYFVFLEFVALHGYVYVGRRDVFAFPETSEQHDGFRMMVCVVDEFQYAALVHEIQIVDYFIFYEKPAFLVRLYAPDFCQLLELDKPVFREKVDDLAQVRFRHAGLLS